MTTYDPDTGGIMEEAGNILTNKWVLIGGVALGALVLFMRMSGGAGSTAPASGYDPTAAIVAANQQAGANYAVATQAAAQTGAAQFAANGVVATAFYNTLTNLANVNGQVSIAQAQSSAGVVNTAITQSALQSMGIAASLAQARIAGLNSDAAVQIARSNAAAAQSATTANMWATLGGGLTKIIPSLLAAA